ncbi:MAG: tripartite tricarboxylate transporter substrate binding protein [Candidatus Atribacteria bacterium]|nr:tripartite tricarboxylate transporter substrate binding protein [Candidatus Atribacteria bacterium]
MLKKSFYYFAFSLLLICLLIGFTTTVMASYPEKDIKVIVHVSPGGGTDTMIRLVTRYLGEKLGVNFIVEDHSGAGGQIGYTALSMAEPDGYTIGSITTMSIVTMELTREGVAFTLKDSFEPIARLVLDPSVCVVPANSPYQTLEDMIQAAKENPGKINWGGTMLYGTHHIQAVLLEKEAEIKLNYIPYDGFSELLPSILGEQIDSAASGMTEWLPQIKEGKLRALAFAGPSRTEWLQGVPTYKELGYEVAVGSNRGLAAPAETPKEYIEILSNAVKEVLQDPEFLKDAERIGIVPILGYLNGETFKDYLLTLQDNMREILK